MLPQDPAILLSYVNTQLRDRYQSLEELCDDLDVDGTELQKKLAGIGYAYHADTNQFQ